MTDPQRPKILLAPANLAAMPGTLAAALRARGYDAAQLQYASRGADRFGYPTDRRVVIAPGQRIPQMLETVRQTLEEGFDIFHFWNRSLLFRTDYGGMSGMDVPLIKARGRRIVHRFTGFDLRLPSRDVAVNPHSPFRHGVRPMFDEDVVLAYQDMLRAHVDRFIVADPEMRQFFPEAEIVPRALNLADWQAVGLERRERPLVAHAPTAPLAKGTAHVRAAVAALQAEGLAFDFKLVHGLSHANARAIYEQADIIVDQLLIGATGVLTLEGWALGKPVVVNLRRDLFEPFYGTKDLPVANANPDTIVDVLRDLIKDADRRLELGRRGRALVEAHHDIDKVVDRYIDIYAGVMAAPRPATGDGDLRYLALQVARSENKVGEVRRWALTYRDAYRREAALARALAGGALDFRQKAGAARLAALPLLAKDRRNLARRIGRWLGRRPD